MSACKYISDPGKGTALTSRADLFDDVIVFAIVAEKLSFTAAANELGLTTAAVSFAIKRLEDRIDLRLLTRTTRSVRLTEAGAVLLKHVLEGAAQVAAGIAAGRRIAACP